MGIDRRQEPLSLEESERPLHQSHVHALLWVELVAGRELGTQRTTPHAERGDDLALAARIDTRACAPGDELRVALDVVDQRVHAALRLCDERGALDLFHRSEFYVESPLHGESRTHTQSDRREPQGALRIL